MDGQRRASRVLIEALMFPYVSGRSRRRLERGPLKFRVGRVELIKHGTKRFDFGDPYHLAITMSWWAFFASCLS
jgi:hypothetical protein